MLASKNTVAKCSATVAKCSSTMVTTKYPEYFPDIWIHGSAKINDSRTMTGQCKSTVLRQSHLIDLTYILSITIWVFFKADNQPGKLFRSSVK